ncbi:HhH-GPD-type base excision DNA repair protein [Nigerium massiliense]|uniref:HhH-GPD-type base excision DNA repair protein n=1 Tax=Nigerium massiliense TaxID=1522317 RepID=UPI0005915829|nr:HhH-GPD-type base excision DNA repair protein [Nigerium massiliense]
MSRTMYLTGDEDADRLLAEDANALLIGMLLDQQVPMEKAFRGPAVLAERLGGTLDVRKIATMDTSEFVELCSKPPAIHRFPKSMGERVQNLCRVLVDEWDGDAANLYAAASTGKELKKLLLALPGFGEQKAKIFVALLGKRWHVTPAGWREAAGDYGLDGHRSVADITSAESLQQVRAFKKQAKAAARAEKASGN